jgi:3-oxoacyl-[acyl-carrier-protein] synthase III
MVDIMHDKVAIMGIGETEYVWKSQRGHNADATEAARLALVDAGIKPSEVDGTITDGRFQT